MTQSLNCWHCGKSLDDVPRPISRHANCDHCFEVLHCCRMCLHYDSERRPYCDHDLADPPEVKENANFCEYFKPVNRFDAGNSVDKEHVKSKLDSLFDHGDQSDDLMAEEGGEPSQALPRNDPKSKLDDLFGD